MMLARYLIKLAEVEEFRKLVKMEHRLVFAVVAKKGDIFAEIHILEVIGDKAAVATLDAFAKILQNFFFRVIFHVVMEMLSQ